VIQARNGTVRVQTPHGAFAAAADGGVMVGQKATFVVRADLMRPVATPSTNSAENTISGVIKGLEYAGSVVLMVLDLGDGRELKVEQHESLSRGETAPRHGASVTVRWTATDAYLLPTT
jgi:ABC-type Fe3+/spermidine/putrescine transport system ATPase subunit